MPEIKNLRKAAERILQATKNKERIVLYGDADPDGVASVVILKETLQKLGSPKLTIYFPDREKEGYGINEQALNYLAKKGAGLLIALDCGMGNVREVALAKDLGFEVLIIDHHQVPPGLLPKTPIVVNPRQKTDKYPFKSLATAGIVYKLVRYLLFGVQFSKSEDFLSLVALATLADQMPLLDENKELVNDGLLTLFFTKRKGVLALLDFVGFSPSSRSLMIEAKEHISAARQKILPILNAAQLKGHLNQAYLLLVENSLPKARKIVRYLAQRAEERRKEIQRIFTEIEFRLQDKSASQSLVFEGGENWTLSCLGPVASKLCQKYDLPVFLFKRMNEKSRGAVRVPRDFDAVKAMTSCSHLLQTYGGHAPAAGFTVKNENLEKFKKRLLNYFK